MAKEVSKRTAFLTRTALGLALVLLAQLLGKMIPAMAVIFGPFSLSQLITGTIINCVLIVFTVRTGFWSGALIGVLSSVLATMLGMGPIFPLITPAIAVGNVLLVFSFWLLGRRGKGGAITAVILGAGVKCAFLWVCVPTLLKLIPEALPAQIKVLTIMFSWPQGITALCGGFIALVVLSRLKKAS